MMASEQPLTPKKNLALPDDAVLIDKTFPEILTAEGSVSKLLF